ncbi:MAG: hypothetical protein RLZZ535_2609 [Cyanobacteriota bacterium]|jgi:hypothetical protein
MDSLIDMLNISIADAKEIGQEFDYDFTSNFSDGESDGENNFEPIAYQWFNSDYRKGYLSGIAKRIGMKDVSIYSVETNQVFLSSCVAVGKA